MIRPARRTEAFGDTIFGEITALAQEHGAVNLGQGFPDFAPPDYVLEAAQEAIAEGSHQYARGPGALDLVEAVAQHLAPRLGRPLDPLTEVTITVGATEGLFASTLALVDPGDEAVLIEPFYDSYPANVVIAGGSCRHVPLRLDGSGRWGIDPVELRAAFSPRTRVIFVNTPHNPTGKVFDREELELVASLCIEHDVVAICDEVYEHIIFDDRQHIHLASIPGMADRTITVSSAGKTFSVTGWKIGWVVACPRLSAAVRRIHQWIPFCVATPLQHAASRAMREAHRRGYYHELRQTYSAKRDLLVSVLASSGLRPLVPQGTYFVVADFADVGTFPDDVAFCRWLTTEVGVAAIPPSTFYCEEHRHLARHLARFCFCKGDETLAAAAARLGQLPARRPG